MSTPLISSSLENEVSRIRELSREGRHSDALDAAEALAVAEPRSRDAFYLIAANQRCLNRVSEALRTLENLELHHPRHSLLHQERGHCYVALRDAPHAIQAFAQAVHLNPALLASWAMLERLYRMAGDAKSAALAAEQISTLQGLPPEIVRAGSLFSDGELELAEKVLRDYLRDSGDHVEALRLLGRIAHQHGKLDDAEQLLEAAMQWAPQYHAVRLDHARVLVAAQKYNQARESIGLLYGLEPDNGDYISLLAAACAGVGEHGQAVGLYQQLLEGTPDSWELHMALGHSLKNLGRLKEAIEAFRAAARIRPALGDAWWSLANLKSYRFSESEIACMHAEESDAKIQSLDRVHLCFALGKAYEDRDEFAESWRYYERGNALKQADVRCDSQIFENNTRRQIEVCTARFLATRAGAGVPDRDPIFIVGLPRSGSTLVEQILSSHSQVEGTQELPDIPRIASELEQLNAGSYDDDRRYPEVLASLAPEDFQRLGARYLSATRAYRGDRPFFIDKMPNNFRHIGLIHLILPNATIIDVRREPMSCCFSNLKQLFASGQEFTYSMGDVARYYRTYLELMRHWDAALPQRVLHVSYEDLVEDLDGNVRRILEFCGLEFEPGCLEFYKTQRSVRTPSSEQVRKPIFREGLHQWRNYEAWLGPLKDALGDAVVRYRA